MSRTKLQRHDVPILQDGADEYADWKGVMEAIFEATDLLDIVNGTEKKPDANVEPDAAADWTARDREARAQIFMSVRGHALKTILGVKSSSECWKKLSSRFEGQGDQQVAHLLSDLYLTTLSDTEAMAPQLEHKMQLARTLETLGCPIPENLLAWMIVIALPETHKSILYSMPPPDKLSTDHVIGQILANEQRPLRASITQEHLRAADLRDGWLIDSGASRIMTSRHDWFTHLTPFASPIQIVLGDDSTILATGTGQVQVRMRARGAWSTAILRDVLYVPDLKGNLLSVSHFAQRGAEVRFQGQTCGIYDDNKLICEGKLHGNVYTMAIQMPKFKTARTATLDPILTEGDHKIEAPLAALKCVGDA